jgi:hypothetical protein
LEEFDPIAEGVTELEPVVTGDRNSRRHFDAQAGQFGVPAGQVADLVSDVPLGGVPVDAVLDADVDLLIPDLQPESPPLDQAGRFVELRQAEDDAVEPASLLFRPFRDR